MKEILENSIYFGFFITVGAYLAGLMVKKKLKLAIFNPLLIAILIVMLVLTVTGVDYDAYQQGGQFVSGLLTPATVCLAIPLYKQLHMLKKHGMAVAVGITSGVITSAVCIFLLCKVFGLGHEHYVTLLPKSITTAIGMGVSEEAGGIVTLTVMSIVVTGIIGNMCAEAICRLARITHPVAKGLAIGTSSHALGTAKALELGEIEGAMSSLSIAVAGLMTVVVVPMVAGLI
ncbi:MAG: LrgB family protein [Lachnospiraceae bacterium]|nr:LrgB family protein [Lachnospiraceae bacterium]